MSCCTAELKIQSSKHIQEDFALFWLSVSSGCRSFQLHSKTKKLSATIEGIRLNWTTEQCRWSKKRMAKQAVFSQYTLLLSLLGLTEHLPCQAWAVHVIKTGRDRERSESGKGLTHLYNTHNVTGDQILLSLEQRRLWGDPRAISQNLQEPSNNLLVTGNTQPGCLQQCPVAAWNKMGTSWSKRGSDGIGGKTSSSWGQASGEMHYPKWLCSLHPWGLSRLRA